MLFRSTPRAFHQVFLFRSRFFTGQSTEFSFCFSISRVQSIRKSSTESSKSIRQFFSDHLSFPFLQYKEPLHVKRAERQFIYDVHGKRYLDFFAGIVTVGIGHCHPRLIEAANKQMHNYWHLSSYYLQDAVRDYAEKLLGHFQDDKHLSVRTDNLLRMFDCSSRWFI